MKKIYKYIPVSAFLLSLLISCGDNENFSQEHILTDDEIKEIARQDSILEAQKNRINADLILEYKAEVIISSKLYDGTSVEVETDKIAELFDISVEELMAGIDKQSDAPEVKGFAINWTNRTDYADGSTTNARWGHWWNKNGDVVGWGTDAYVAAEFDTEENLFHVSQYPGRLIDGQVITFIECLKYNDKRAAVVIEVTAKEADKIEATIVGTQKLSIETYLNFSHDDISVKFDYDKVLGDLGVTTLENAKFIALNPDQSFNQESDQNQGFWLNIEGFAENGSNSTSYVYYDINGEEKDCILLNQKPKALKVGDIAIVKYGIVVGNKVEMLEVEMKIIEYPDPEEKPQGDPIDIDWKSVV